MTKAIEVAGLEKSYGANHVLKGVTFEVAKGEIFALLGVNGAGKTTTLEIIEGLRTHDAGTVRVNGKPGIQLQSASLPPQIKPLEAVKLFALWNRATIDREMLDNLGIGELAKKQYAGMSTGQKRRLHLALALIGDPDIVFLDEPTAGLDVEGRVALHAEIRKLRERGKTIILASHDMAEVEALADTVAILKDGRIAFSGTQDELSRTLGKRFNVTIKTAESETHHEVEDVAAALLDILADYRAKNLEVLDIRVNRGSLEQHFIELSGRKHS